ncbi:MAG: YaaL family protein [Lachnospiraceae bacterium]|nr:YaaL family protein [Lachnospiraceae bacterium]
MLLNLLKKPQINGYYGKQKLLSEIKETKESIDLAYSNFENMTDPELIDCSIYELKAAQMRYEYLLSCAKEYDMSCLYDQVIS